LNGLVSSQQVEPPEPRVGPSDPSPSAAQAAEDRAEYVRRLIAARIPELDQGDLQSANLPIKDEVAMSNPASGDWVPMAVMEKILAVVEPLDERMAGIESWVHTMGRA
jgi:hypothetical protein